MARRKVKNGEKSPWGQVFWHQSEARTAATVWNWSGKTLSPGALLAVLYFSFVPYFSACLDVPSPPLSAPGSLRMSFSMPRFRGAGTFLESTGW